LLILSIYSEAIVEDAEDEEDGEGFHSATTRLQPDESNSELVNQGDENVRMLASNLLEKIANGKLDVVAGTEQLFLMMRTAKYDEQIRRLELVTIIPIEPVKEIKVSDLSKSSYPILTDIGIPLSRTFISALLPELVMLDKANSEAGVLLYSTHRGTTCRLLSIPKSSTKYRFRRNAKHWLKPLFSDCTDCRDDLKVALWAMKAIASEYEVEFIQAAEDCGCPIFTRKMDEGT
jgi:hypothetical protein